MATEVREIHIDHQKYFEDRPFPLVLTPDNSEANSPVDYWCNWVDKHKSFIAEKLLSHCAILFRDFPIKTPADFDNFVKAFGLAHFPYLGGAAPRIPIVGNVYTSSEAPPDVVLTFHHEMCQVPEFPTHLFFYCDTEPQTGGETPIVRSNTAYKLIQHREPEFVQRLEKEGLCYVRILSKENDPSSVIGNGWVSTYCTEDKEEAEQKAAKHGTTTEWTADDCMKTITKPMPAIRMDPRTGNKTWFNSIAAAYLGWEDARNDRFKSVQFPNGDLMPEKAMQTVKDTLDEITVAFPWKKGDVVCIDNRQVLHGRYPFTPPRRILACLCKEETE